MLDAIRRTLNDTKISPSPRVVLEAAAVLFERSGSVSVTAEALRAEIAARAKQPISDENFRKRLSRLNEALDEAGAPFSLHSVGGTVTAQPNARYDAAADAAELDRGLAAFSLEGTALGANAPVQPRAIPDRLLVMFSYAWQGTDTVGKQLHHIQDQFYKTLERQLSEKTRNYKFLPKIELWRDEKKIDNSAEGTPQMDAACRQAFLGLLLVSRRYPHRPACGREADYFLTENGENQKGKRCIVVPLNAGLDEIDARFSKHNRIWIFDKKSGKPLDEAWAGASGPKRDRLVQNVALAIFKAAEEYLGKSTTPDAGTASLDAETISDETEQLAKKIARAHQLHGVLDPFAKRAQLTADLKPSTPEVISEQPGVEIVSALADWACSNEGPRLTALLGEFGMGKTVTCQMLNRHLLTRLETDPLTPLSLYFDLREIGVSKETGPGALEKIMGDLLYRAGTTTLDANKVIDHIRKTACFVIFDGIDEVTNKLSAEQAMRFYRELLSIAPAETWKQDAERRRKIKIGDKEIPPPIKGPRILVSCRSHYFRDLATQRGFLIERYRAGVTADEDIHTYFMLPFTNEQIERYLTFHLGDADGARAWDLIGETYNLKELAERPILLRFITETFSHLEEAKRTGQIVNIARLYDVFVDQTFTRDEPKHIIPIREKRRLLTDLARELHRDGPSELSHEALEDWFIDAAPSYPRLAAALSGADGLKLSEILLQDLRNATLLVRRSDSGFRFGHTSIREYFLADAIVNSIAAGTGAADLDLPTPSPETLSFILARLDIADLRLSQKFNVHFPLLLATGSPRAVRTIAFALWQRSDYRLPRPSVLDLTDLDFFDTRFTGTAARRIPLHHSRWQGARLNMVEFEHVDLTDGDFSGVEARMAHILSCRLDRTLFRGADLQGSIWRHLDARSADFTGANLRDAHRHVCQEWPVAPGEAPEPPADAKLFRLQHLGGVTEAVLGTIDGRNVILSSSMDGTVQLWDALSGDRISTFAGQTGWATSVAIGQINERGIVGSGSSDGTVWLWDVISGDKVGTLTGHSGWVSSIAFGQIKQRSIIVSGGTDSTILLWDASSREKIATLAGHTGEVTSVAFGKVGGRGIIVSSSIDRTVRLWSVDPVAPLATLAGHDGMVMSVALGDVDGRSIIVSGSDDQTVRLWDATSGQLIFTWPSHEGRITSVALGEIGGRNIVVSGSQSGTVRIWDAAPGATISTLTGHTGWVASVAIGQIARRSVIISGGGDRSIRLWDAVSKDKIATLSGSTSWFTSVTIGEVSGRYILISGTGDKNLQLWDAVSGDRISTLAGHTSWVPSVAVGKIVGRSIIVSGGDDRSVRLWDAVSGVNITTLAGHQGMVTSVVLGTVADRNIIVSGGDDHTVRLWDAISGDNVAILVGHEGMVTSVALGKVGNRSIIVSGSLDQTARIWDAVSGAPVSIIARHNGWVKAVALGDVLGRCIVVSGGLDKDIRIIDALSGQTIATLAGHERMVTSVAIGEVAGRGVIVSGSDDHTVRLWDAISAECITILAWDLGQVTSVALCEIEGNIVIASIEGGVLHRVTLNPHTFAVERRLILGPGPDTRIETIPAPDGGDRIISASDDAWRYWRVQGRVDGRLVMRMVDDVVEPVATRA